MAALDLTFYYPTQAAPTTTTLIRAPNFGDTETIDRQQVIDDSAAGVLITYDRGPVLYRLGLEFEFMTKAMRDLLETFFNTIAVGAKNTFELRIPRYSDMASGNNTALITGGFLYTGCSFEHGNIEFSQMRNGWFGTTLNIRALARSVVG